MKYARKLPQCIQAWQLGHGSLMEQQLLAEGRLRITDDGRYEVLSQESGSTGELASPGDWIKLDGSGFPYPNKNDWFSARHRHLEGDTYEQLPGAAMQVWFAGDSLSPEVQWLLDSKKLTLKPDDPTHYFNAFLWGAALTSPIDSALVLYSVDRDEQGKIAHISFNFVARSEFDRTYELLPSAD